MEVAKEEPGKEPEPRVLSEDTNGVSTQKEEKRDEKEVKCKTREEQEKQSQKRIINLQRDLTAIVADVLTAADAKVVQKRTQLNKAKEIRAELLENDVKSSQEKLDELERGCLQVSQKMILPDLQEVRNKRQELYAALVQEKNKLINELQQELKLEDDCYVKDLRKNAEEKDLMIERMKDQTLTQAYREELDKIQRVHQQELKFLLLEDISKWEEDLKEMWDKELEKLSERRTKKEEHEEKIHKLRFQIAHDDEALELKSKAKAQDQQRKNQKLKNDTVLKKLKDLDREDQAKELKLSLANHKILSNEIQKLKQSYMKEQQELTKLSRALSAKEKRQVQKCQRIKEQIKHFAVADARKFEAMRLMTDADVKQLAERAVLIDSVMCKQLLGLPWEQPPLASLELSGPSRSQELAGNSDGPELETEYFFIETQKKVKELLCREADFLMETNVLKLLAPLENEEQTDMKLSTLLYSLGLSDKDLPELTDFILKYKQQQREQNKDDCAESSDLAEAAEGGATNSASELINPNHVLPALKKFLEHKSLRGSSAHHDSSETEAYWESLVNVISEEKLQLWDAAERKLKEYNAVVTEISDHTLETDCLKQQNSELRMQLQQHLTSTVD